MRLLALRAERVTVKRAHGREFTVVNRDGDVVRCTVGLPLCRECSVRPGATAYMMRANRLGRFPCKIVAAEGNDGRLVVHDVRVAERLVKLNFEDLVGVKGQCRIVEHPPLGIAKLDLLASCHDGVFLVEIKSTRIVEGAEAVIRLDRGGLERALRQLDTARIASNYAPHVTATIVLLALSTGVKALKVKGEIGRALRSRRDTIKIVGAGLAAGTGNRGFDDKLELSLTRLALVI